MQIFCSFLSFECLPKIDKLRDTAKCPIILGINETCLDGSVLNGMVDFTRTHCIDVIKGAEVEECWFMYKRCAAAGGGLTLRII